MKPITDKSAYIGLLKWLPVLEVERWRYLYRDRVDTLYMSKTDTVTVHDVEYRDKPERWYDTGFRRLGQLCVLGLLAWLLWCLVKRKI